jgi:hypothetical protein
MVIDLRRNQAAKALAIHLADDLINFRNTASRAHQFAQP